MQYLCNLRVLCVLPVLWLLNCVKFLNKPKNHCSKQRKPNSDS